MTDPHPADRWLRPQKEPPLDDVLDDPLVATLMARDGVARDELMDLIQALRYLAWQRRTAGGARTR